MEMEELFRRVHELTGKYPKLSKAEIQELQRLSKNLSGECGAERMHKCLVCGGNILFGPNIVKDPKTDAFGRKITSHRFGFCENFCNRYEEVNGKLAQSVLVPVRI